MNTEKSEIFDPDAEIGVGPEFDKAVSLPLLTTERTQKLDLLLHLLANVREGLVLCGPEGIGKSELLARVLDRSLDSWVVCRLTATYELTFEDMQKQLLSMLENDSAVVLTKTLDAALQQLQQQKRQLILLLDDAGALVPGIVTSVCEFAETWPALRPVFSMTADRLHLLAASDPAVESCQVIEIPPLTEHQCGEFLRLLAASPDAVLSARAINTSLVHQVYLQSHGVPGRIIGLLPEFARGTLLGVSGNSLPLFGLMAFGIAVFAGYLLWNNTDNSPVSVQNRSAVAPVKRVIELPGMIEERPSKTVQTRAAPDAAAVPDSLVEPAGAAIESATASESLTPQAITGTTVATVSRRAGSMGVDPDEHLVSVEADPSAGHSIPADASVDGVDASAEPAESEAAMGEQGSGGREARAESSVAVVNGRTEGDEQVKDESVVTAPAKLEESPVEAGGSTSGTEEKADRPADDALFPGIHDAGWILEQNPNRYTLQLLAVKNYDSMRRFIDKNRELGGLAVFKTRKNNAQWFALIYGLYPSLRAAENAAAELPGNLRKSWPRKMKSVHNAINAFGPQ